jgi:hypothetical protein
MSESDRYGHPKARPALPGTPDGGPARQARTHGGAARPQADPQHPRESPSHDGERDGLPETRDTDEQRRAAPAGHTPR